MRPVALLASAMTANEPSIVLERPSRGRAPPLPPPANGWLPVYYEVSEDSGVLRLGEYRVDGGRVWARNAAGSVRFLPRSEHRADVAVARCVLHMLDHGL